MKREPKNSKVETKSKGIHEGFAIFFENPTRETLRELLERNYGETNQLDFKAAWPALTKVARHILAMANSSGGVLVAGIAESPDGTLEAVGLSELVDKAKITQGVGKFLPQFAEYEVLDFTFTASEYPAIRNKKFQVMIIEDRPQYLPFVSEDAGDGIRKAAIYVRRVLSSEEAMFDELQHILNRPIETGYSSQSEFDLVRELKELELLYTKLDRFTSEPWMRSFSFTLSGGMSVPNPAYPAEDFPQFVNRMIKVKKTRIEMIIGK